MVGSMARLFVCEEFTVLHIHAARKVEERLRVIEKLPQLVPFFSYLFFSCSLFIFYIILVFTFVFIRVSAVVLLECLFFTLTPELMDFVAYCSQIYPTATDLVPYLFSAVCG